MAKNKTNNKTELLGIRVRPELKAAIEAAAESTAATPAAMARKVLEDHFCPARESTSGAEAVAGI